MLILTGLSMKISQENLFHKKICFPKLYVILKELSLY